jgi:hypothetical protein
MEHESETETEKPVAKLPIGLKWPLRDAIGQIAGNVKGVSKVKFLPCSMRPESPKAVQTPVVHSRPVNYRPPSVLPLANRLWNGLAV